MTSDDAEPWTAQRLFALLGERLGEDYRITVDDTFVWLTPFADDEHEQHARAARYAVVRVGELIPGLVATPPQGGWPAVLFASVDDQLAYEDCFPGEGSSIISGGMWQPYPVGHMAIPVTSSQSVDAAFAHELVHAMLDHRGVPLWLQEGIACEVETRLGSRMDPLADLDQLRRTLAYWRGRDADPFWTGAAFSAPESSEHAYGLAQVLSRRWTRQPHALLEICRLPPDGWDDENTALGVSRESLLQQVLAPPRAKSWVERTLFALFVGDRAP